MIRWLDRRFNDVHATKIFDKLLVHEVDTTILLESVQKKLCINDNGIERGVEDSKFTKHLAVRSWAPEHIRSSFISYSQRNT